jgi:hypothetical protein
VRDSASKGGRSRRPSWFPNSEGSMCAVGRRDGVAPPGSKAGSCTGGDRRNMRGPPGSAGSRVRRIGPRRGMRARHCRRSHPCRGRESDRFIVPMKPSKETRRAAGRGRPEGSPREGARARTPGPGRGAGPPCRLTSVATSLAGERGGSTSRPYPVQRPASSRRPSFITPTGPRSNARSSRARWATEAAVRWSGPLGPDRNQVAVLTVGRVWCASNCSGLR